MAGAGGRGGSGGGEVAGIAGSAGDRGVSATRPGEIIPGDGPVPLNPGRDRVTMVVTNTADRPVQVGSHFHFAATNAGLEFDRAAAWGRHLDIPSGTSVRFEPGIEREVALVPFGGARVVPGLRVEFAGPLDERDHEPRSVPYGRKAAPIQETTP